MCHISRNRKAEPRRRRARALRIFHQKNIEDRFPPDAQKSENRTSSVQRLRNVSRPACAGRYEVIWDTTRAHIHTPYCSTSLVSSSTLRPMHNFMNRLIERSIAKSQSSRVAKLQIKNEWIPDIVISRDPGSGGQIIAKKIAKKLNWQIFNKKLMVELSEELKIPSSDLLHVDEHSRSWFADIFQSISTLAMSQI